MVGIERLCDVFHGLKPGMLMVFVQVAFAALNVMYKLAVNDGMRMRVLIAYRFIFGFAFMLPLALFFERGSLTQNHYGEGLVLTSPTFATALQNLVPAVTFIMSIPFGLESLRLGSAAGKAKLAGTLVGTAGAMLLTFYKGPEVVIWSTNIDLVRHRGQMAPSGSNIGLGCLLLMAFSVSCASWLILQNIVYALCLERDWSQWKLGWNIRLLTCVYAGAVVNGVMFTAILWCVEKRGPVFVSAFNPLLLVMVAVASSILLEEKLHVGFILGAVLIICGLCAVVWGKGKDMKRMNQLTPSTNKTDDSAEVMVVTTSDENVEVKNSC